MEGTTSTNEESSDAHLDNDMLGQLGDVERIEESCSVSTTTEPDQTPISMKLRAAEEERQKLGKVESQAIFVLRVVVMSLFGIMTVSFTVIVYFYVRNDEETTFEDEFGGYASRIQNRFTQALQNRLYAVDALSIMITDYALEHGETFPFLTIPNFEYKGSSTRVAGGTPMAFYMPLVTTEMRPAWEAYTRNHSSDLREAYIIEQQEKQIQDEKYGLDPVVLEGDGLEALLSGEFSPGGGPSPVIFFPDSNYTNPEGPYFPIWQSTPMLPPGADMVNVNLIQYSHLEVGLNVVLETGEACISPFTNLGSNDQKAGSIFDLVLQFGQYRHNSEHYQDDPVSALNYPVFDSFGPNRTLVGVIYTNIYWRFLFSDIIPPQIDGIDCVVENSSGQQRTFRVDGADASFVDVGDLHDTSFNYLGESVNVEKYMNENASSPETRTFTMVDINSDTMNTTLHVYPSNKFRDNYVSGDASRNSLAVGFVFVLGLLIFGVYDCCVRRRQRIVMDRAVKATAVVSSLFPEQVREQVINDHHEKNPSEARKNPFSNLVPGLETATDNDKTRPLAEKYPNCTVYFADLVGFTQWSSTREPEQVFQLLETMYKKFDKIALKRGVFKVETIGDCYMAVTGLPVAQPDHAVIMSKFAEECLRSLDKVCADLSGSLGAGTGDLTLRMGMHSGEVTGGVLRGDKSRFQLFGDTVNTASRMESLGVPRRVQCSQTTADALTLAGKTNWVTPREDKVVAKGKGEMQTYFVQVKDRSDKSVYTEDVGDGSSSS